MNRSEPILQLGRRFHATDRAQALEWLAVYNLGTLISAGDDGWPRASTSALVVRLDDANEPRITATWTDATRRSTTCLKRGGLSTSPMV